MSVLEYLTNVLSQRGPTAVPYDESVKWNIRDHVSELQKVFPTLTSKLSEYHSNDGRLLNVLKVEGTMPIHYQGAKYNIPILMWLAERYPYSAPQVYVVPTANMIIRPSNVVDPSGYVTTPLLRSWLFPSSNLVDVVLEMSQVFGGEPPLYTRPPGYVPPLRPSPSGITQPPPHYPTSHGTMASTPGSGSSIATAATSNGYSNMGYATAQSGPTPYTGGSEGRPNLYTSGESRPSQYGTHSSLDLYASAQSVLTPYATPSAGNTPNSTPGTATGPVGWGTGGGPSAARPFGAPPGLQPPPPPPAFGLGGFFGGLFGGGGGGGPPPPPVVAPPSVAAPPSSQAAVQQPVPPPPPQPQPQVLPPPPPPPPPEEPQRPPVSREELEVHFRHLAIEALAARMRALHHGFGEFASEETVKALEVQNQLGERRAKLQAVHDALTKERMSTEQQVAELASKTKALQVWLGRNEPVANKYDPEAVSASSLLVPADELSQQGMETQARDLALEDTILALDKLLQTGQVPLDVYLKQVRALCRKQFFSRALGLKVAEAQQQAAARPPLQLQQTPSARFQTSPYPLLHGDGWSRGGAPPPPVDGLGYAVGASPYGGLAPGPATTAPSTGMLTNPLAGR